VKTIAIVVRTASADRAAEALRAAVGLTLRGDHVVVAIGGVPRAVTEDPRVERGLATVRLLGHRVDEDDGAAALAAADAVEVWT
jgi:hypothetical protein